VLSPFQALAGLELTLELGVERLREYSLVQKTLLGDLIPDVQGIGADYGAFVTIRRPDAPHLAAELAKRKVKVDARGEYLRICPDILNSRAELEQAATALKDVLPLSSGSPRRIPR
jgi:kynureninase